MTELIVDNVQKWLGGLQILKGASFTASRGAIVALLGRWNWWMPERARRLLRLPAVAQAAE